MSKVVSHGPTRCKRDYTGIETDMNKIPRDHYAQPIPVNQRKQATMIRTRQQATMMRARHSIE